MKIKTRGEGVGGVSGRDNGKGRGREAQQVKVQQETRASLGICGGDSLSVSWSCLSRDLPVI